MILRGGVRAARSSRRRAARRLPAGAPVPPHPAAYRRRRLLGGIDLTATCRPGDRWRRSGLLANGYMAASCRADGARMSEAVPRGCGGDRHGRDGGRARRRRRLRAAARFVTVALDDGVSPTSARRCASRTASFPHRSVRSSPLRVTGERPNAGAILRNCVEPRSTKRFVRAHAAALGVASARATLFALRAALRVGAARRAACDDGRRLTLAARSCLPRARPACRRRREQRRAAPRRRPSTTAREEERGSPGPIDDVVLAAALAALPPDSARADRGGRPAARKMTRASGAANGRKSAARPPMGRARGRPAAGCGSR
jgi:magnesium chelatase subunit D